LPYRYGPVPARASAERDRSREGWKGQTKAIISVVAQGFSPAGRNRLAETEMSSQRYDKAFHLAVDLGAGSGRVVLGRFGEAELFSREVHRFIHPIVRSAGHLRWDSRHIFGEIKQGVRNACEASRDLGGQIVGLGVDSWGVDYALLDQSGALLEEPVCYRDDRTLGRMEEVFALVSRRRYTGEPASSSSPSTRSISCSPTSAAMACHRARAGS
jgi:hypothetical protein